jgi:drug/metabolite transporter (DMT)-like permease
MWYFFAIGSMLGYAIQQTLLVHHARRIDGLSLAFYRNISFVVTLLPLLFGASAEDFRHVLVHWQMLLASGVAGAVYLALLYSSYKFFSVGVGTSISRALSTISIAAFGWLLLGEKLPPASLLLIGIILIGVVLLGLQHTHVPQLDNRFALGVLYIALGTIPIAFLTYVLAVLSREGSPFVSGYFWETSIAVACAVLLLLRSVFFGKHVQRVSWRTFLIIAACSAPTLIGTGLVSLAQRDGPIGIVNAIGSGLLVISALLAWILYHERLSKGEWASMLLILAGIVGLKFV